MHVHIVDHNTSHLARIEAMVKKYLPGSIITKARTHDKHKEQASIADMVIISGGTWLVHKNPGTHRRLMMTLIAHEKPIFAICLGAEVVAHFFGGKLTEMEHRQQNITRINVVSPKLIKELGSKEALVYEYHKWAITELPESMQVLASSKTGAEFFKHRSLPIYATQFHPEVRKDRNRGHLLFRYAIKELGLKKQDK